MRDKDWWVEWLTLQAVLAMMTGIACTFYYAGTEDPRVWTVWLKVTFIIGVVTYLMSPTEYEK